jgi:hypothetical protein
MSKSPEISISFHITRFLRDLMGTTKNEEPRLLDTGDIF